MGMASACLLVASPAMAEHDRAVPPGLTQTVATTHFVLHYDPSTVSGEPGMTIAQYASAGGADLEEAYSRLVAGGGGSPNAGLLAPIPDADGKTDVYLAPPTTDPGNPGGSVHSDFDHGVGTAHMFMNPEMPRQHGFRTVGAHEFMHVIQDAYTPGAGEILFEGFANWAAEFSIPDAVPLDNNFSDGTGLPSPWVPLDCWFGSHEGVPCGNGYWQWMFIQRQVETYGADFVAGYYNRYDSNPSIDVRTNLDQEIVAQGGPGLRQRYASYARDVWEPTRWATSSIGVIHSSLRRPHSVLVTRATTDTGTVSFSIDHLATRYVRIVNDGGFQPTGPNDEISVFVGRPGDLATSSDYLTRGPNQPFDNNTGPSGGPGTGSIGIGGAGPAGLREVVLPLTNDTISTDNLNFSYRVVFHPGTPTPPANDVQSGAVTANLGVTATTDSVYAGGRGADETPSNECDGVADVTNATRGVWFRFTAPNNGQYTFNSTSSDFPSNVSIFRTSDNAFQGCSGNGSVGTTLTMGTSYDVLVARDSGVINTGTVARLLVSGPGSPPPPDTQAPTVTLNGPSGTITDSTPTFTFSADESATFTCLVDAVTVPCSGPGNSHTTASLPNGPHSFEVRATDAANNVGADSKTFDVQVPDTVAPNVTLGGPSGTITDDTPTFTFSADETATFTCLVDNVVVACSGPGNSHTTGPLPNGAHTFEARATDSSNNVGTASRSFTVQVSMAPPGGGGGTPGAGTPGGSAPGTPSTGKRCKKKGKKRAAAAKKCKRKKRK